MTNRTSEIPATFEWLLRGRVPSLDGLRGVSVLLVIWHHLSLTQPGRSHEGLWHFVGLRARIGVDIFFVISGFIITILLLREIERSGRVSIKQFYLRRIRRILPAYWVFLIGLLLMTHLPLGLPKLTPANWATVLTFMVDIFPVTIEAKHLWTLSVEEHFYLVYPALFLLGSRPPVILAFASLLLIPMARLLSIYFHLPLPNSEFWTFTRADSMAYGCCLAFLATSRFSSRLALSPRLAAVIAVLAVIGLSIGEAGPDTRLLIWFRNVFLHSIDGLCIAALVSLAISRPATYGRLFNWRPLVIVGLMSYSIYLWQQPFTNGTINLPWYVSAACVPLLSVLSYRFIELPFLPSAHKRRVEQTEVGLVPTAASDVPEPVRS